MNIIYRIFSKWIFTVALEGEVLNKKSKKVIGFTTALAIALCLISFESLDKVSERKVYAETSRKIYYVSQSGGYGDGSISNPFNSIQDGIRALSPGDILIIRGGTYHETTDVIDKNGSEDAWFTIKNYPGEEVIMDGDYWANDGSHEVKSMSIEEYKKYRGKDAPDAITFNRNSYWKV